MRRGGLLYSGIFSFSREYKLLWGIHIRKDIYLGIKAQVVLFKLMNTISKFTVILSRSGIDYWKMCPSSLMY